MKLPSYFCKLDIFHKIGKEDFSQIPCKVKVLLEFFEPKFLNTFLRYGTWENWCLCVCVCVWYFQLKKDDFSNGVKNLVYLIDSII